MQGNLYKDHYIVENLPARIGILLPRILSLKTTMVGRNFTQIGLSHSAWAILVTIAKYPGKSTHALAEMSYVTDQSFGQLVAKLAKQGLVERRQGAGRAILHELTDKGRHVLAEAEPLLNAALENFLSPLSRAEMETLADLLERVVTHNGNEILGIKGCVEN